MIPEIVSVEVRVFTDSELIGERIWNIMPTTDNMKWLREEIKFIGGKLAGDIIISANFPDIHREVA